MGRRGAVPGWGGAGPAAGVLGDRTGVQPAHSQGWLPGHVTWAVAQGPRLSLTPKCCCLISLGCFVLFFH